MVMHSIERDLHLLHAMLNWYRPLGKGQLNLRRHVSDRQCALPPDHRKAWHVKHQQQTGLALTQCQHWQTAQAVLITAIYLDSTAASAYLEKSVKLAPAAGLVQHMHLHPDTLLDGGSGRCCTIQH